MRVIIHSICRWLVVLGGSAVLSVGCDSERGTPTVPTSPAVTRIELGGLRSIPSVGQVHQLTATAILADGTRRDVTNSVTWRTSNAGVATISEAGLLTIVGAGQADVSATLEGVTGSLHVVVPEQAPPVVTYAITGAVRETAPTEDVEVGSARVEVVGNSPLAGQVFMTDAEGRFSLPPVSVTGGPEYLVLFYGDVELCNNAWSMEARYPS